MAEMYAVSGETLSTLANAIRTAAGTDDFMTVASMAAKLEGLPVRKETVVISEPGWQGTTKGNAENFFSRFMRYGQTFSGVILGVVTNNTYGGASQRYRARLALTINAAGIQKNVYMRGEAETFDTTIASNYSFYLDQGSTIDFYYLDVEE